MNITQYEIARFENLYNNDNNYEDINYGSSLTGISKDKYKELLAHTNKYLNQLK